MLNGEAKDDEGETRNVCGEKRKFVAENELFPDSFS